ncbi:MAG: hypothetical protein EBQ96_07355 [Proteobacteria bacterium]|nr:hypothetical protein [Pseudomonadota bacterium]
MSDDSAKNPIIDRPERFLSGYATNGAGQALFGDAVPAWFTLPAQSDALAESFRRLADYQIFTAAYDVEAQPILEAIAAMGVQAPASPEAMPLYDIPNDFVLQAIGAVEGGAQVSLIIDHSGSMHEHLPNQIANAANLARALESVGVKVEVLGFTTNSWKGGRARDEWLAAGKTPRAPGRLNETLALVYKSADQPIDRALSVFQEAYGYAVHSITEAKRMSVFDVKRYSKTFRSMLRENIDGEAILAAHRRLYKTGASARALVVFSDEAPVDDATLSVNPDTYLSKHAGAAISLIQAYSPVTVMSVPVDRRHNALPYEYRIPAERDGAGQAQFKTLLENIVLRLGTSITRAELRPSKPGPLKL